MGLAEIFLLLKGGISLIPGIIKTVEKIKETSKEVTLNRVIDSLANDTREESDKLINEMNKIKAILTDNKFDLEKKIGDEQEAFSNWNLIKNYYLNRATDKLRFIQNNLLSSIEEVGRILMCQGKFKDIAEFDNFVACTIRDLNGIEQRSLKEIFELYEKLLIEYKEKLR